MLEGKSISLSDLLAKGGNLGERYLCGINGHVRLKDLLTGSTLGGRLAELSGGSVLLKTQDHFATALALIQLDGVARRITLCPSDVLPSHIPGLIAKAEVDALVTDNDDLGDLKSRIALCIGCSLTVGPAGPPPARQHHTEWLLLTSGTTGVPRMVVHSLAGLTDAITTRSPHDASLIWGTFYDIRRFGGLQTYLRAVLAGGSLVLAGAGDPVGAILARFRLHRVTHLSGTPSHWRRVLMLSGNELVDLRYVRLSGEIADQAVLDGLRHLYPHAEIVHAYASTEAGLIFEVNDGLEGCPASLINAAGDPEMKIVNGTLRVRSRRTATAYAGSAAALSDADGFVDTGDVLQLLGGRYYFLGRRDGVVNVGGLKVHPEEVEAIINRHPSVRMSKVRARNNPFTGAIVTADVLLSNQTDATERGNQLEQEILRICRSVLPEYKVPAVIQFVPNIEIAATGKLVRSNA